MSHNANPKVMFLPAILIHQLCCTPSFYWFILNISNVEVSSCLHSVIVYMSWEVLNYEKLLLTIFPQCSLMQERRCGSVESFRWLKHLLCFDISFLIMHRIHLKVGFADSLTLIWCAAKYKYHREKFIKSI